MKFYLLPAKGPTKEADSNFKNSELTTGIGIYFEILNEDRLITKENLQNDKVGESNKMGEYVQN